MKFSCPPRLCQNRQAQPRRVEVWRNDITGLRALAVLPVLLYHAFPELLPGGYFGVDIFFVISGYLISGIIFRGLLKGDFNYVVFYEKRIKRIIPNLVLLLLTVIFVGWHFLLASEYANLGKHVFSSSLFVQNFRLLGESGYFTEDALRKPLLHLWSLAIEEQFYIIFPIIVWFVWRFGHQSFKSIGCVVLGITVGSFIYCIFSKDPSFKFYFPLTRFWEIGAGIVIAYVESFQIFSFKQLARPIRHALSCIGVVAVLWVFFVTDRALHPGWITLVPVIGATLIIIACPDAVMNRTLLSWRPMTFIGVISYSLYLWHWPLLAYIFICIPNASNWLKVCALILSFVIATAVYFCVENPLRRAQWSMPKWRSPLVLIICALVVTAGLGYISRHSKGFPDRHFVKEYASMEDIRRWIDWKNEKKLKLPGVLTSIYVHNGVQDVPEVLLIGDSHAEQYWLRLKDLGLKYGKTTGIMWSSGCFPFADYKMGKACSNLRMDLETVLNSGKVKAIIIANKWGGRIWLKEKLSLGLSDFSEKLQEKAIPLYVILDAPWDEGSSGSQGTFDPLKHFNRLQPLADLKAPPPIMKKWQLGNEIVVKTLSGKARIIDPYAKICSDDICDLRAYRDDDHLRPSWVKEHADWLDLIFEDQFN